MGPIFDLPGWRGNFHPNYLIFWANGFYYAISKENAVQHNFLYVYPPPFPNIVPSRFLLLDREVRGNLEISNYGHPIIYTRSTSIRSPICHLRYWYPPGFLNGEEWRLFIIQKVLRLAQTKIIPFWFSLLLQKTNNTSYCRHLISQRLRIVAQIPKIQKKTNIYIWSGITRMDIPI